MARLSTNWQHGFLFPLLRVFRDGKGCTDGGVKIGVEEYGRLCKISPVAVLYLELSDYAKLRGITSRRRTRKGLLASVMLEPPKLVADIRRCHFDGRNSI